MAHDKQAYADGNTLNTSAMADRPNDANRSTLKPACTEPAKLGIVHPEPWGQLKFYTAHKSHHHPK